MPLRLSDRTSNSKALSTICRLVFRRVSFSCFTDQTLVDVDVSSHAATIHHSQAFLCITLRPPYQKVLNTQMWTLGIIGLILTGVFELRTLELPEEGRSRE